MVKPPVRRIADWAPAAGPVEAWLARWAEHGWVPEWAPPYAGVEVVIGGSRRVVRWAMVRAATDADLTTHGSSTAGAVPPG